MNKYIIDILILVIFYYPIEVKAQSGFGLTLESAHFKWSKAEVINYRGSCCYEFEKVYNSSGLLFNIIIKANQLSFGYSLGKQRSGNGSDSWGNGAHSRDKQPRSNGYISYRRYDIINMFPKSQRLSNILRLSPAFTIIYGDGYDDGWGDEYHQTDFLKTSPFSFNVGLYAHFIRWGDIQPFLGFSLPLNEGIHSWFLSLGLSYNRMLGKDSKDFEDF